MGVARCNGGRTAIITARAAAILVGFALVGCGTTDQGGSAASGGSFSDKFSQLFSGSASPVTPLPDEAKTEPTCPRMEIRSGAASYPIHATVREGGQTLRFQATIGRLARECTVVGQIMTIKVGVEGRLLSGPGGSSGKADVPIRIAVIEEGLQPKTIWTKFYKVAAEMPEGQTQSIFIHVDDGVSFPLPKPDELENYVIYVGFDPTGKPEKEQKPQKTPRRPARAG